MILIPTAQNIGDEIENFLLFQHHEQVGRHHGYLTGLDALHFFAIDIDPLVGIAEIGVDGDIITTQVHHHASQGLSVFLGDHDGCKLLIDLFTWIDNLVEQVVGTVASPGSREVRPGHTSGIPKTVTGIAGRCRKHLLSLHKITSFHTVPGRFAQIFEFPHRGSPAREDRSRELDRTLSLRFLRDERSVLLFLGIAKGGK